MTGARRRKRRPQPSYKEEQSLLDRGFSLVAGLDEVGRGPVAGPVLAAAAILRPKPRGRWVRMVRDGQTTRTGHALPERRGSGPGDRVLLRRRGRQPRHRIGHPARHAAGRRRPTAPSDLSAARCTHSSRSAHTPEGHSEGRLSLHVDRRSIHRSPSLPKTTRMPSRARYETSWTRESDFPNTSGFSGSPRAGSQTSGSGRFRFRQPHQYLLTT